MLWRREQPSEDLTMHEARRRRATLLGGIHVEDFVFGANDGVITTFAVIAGATGGALGTAVIVILGFANLFADAVSMGAGNYLGKRSRADYIRSQRDMEAWEIEHTPETEREEVRRLFQEKGLKGEELDTVVEAITGNRAAWLDIMMTEELGLTESVSPPLAHALAIALAFILAGMVPLMPYLFCSGFHCFVISALLAALVLFVAGSLRTLITGINWLRGGLEMLGIGSAAAVIAFGIGRLIAGVTSLSS